MNYRGVGRHRLTPFFILGGRFATAAMMTAKTRPDRSIGVLPCPTPRMFGNGNDIFGDSCPRREEMRGAARILRHDREADRLSIS